MLFLLFLMGSFFITFCAIIANLIDCYCALITKRTYETEYGESYVYEFELVNDVIVHGIIAILPVANFLLLIKSLYGIMTPLASKLNNYVNENVNKLQEKIDEAVAATKNKTKK